MSILSTLAEAYCRQRWSFAAAGVGEVGDMPLYAFTEDGGSAVTPAAELWLPDRAAEQHDVLLEVTRLRGDAVCLASTLLFYSSLLIWLGECKGD